MEDTPEEKYQCKTGIVNAIKTEANDKFLIYGNSIIGHYACIDEVSMLFRYIKIIRRFFIKRFPWVLNAPGLAFRSRWKRSDLQAQGSFAAISFSSGSGLGPYGPFARRRIPRRARRAPRIAGFLRRMHRSAIAPHRNNRRCIRSTYPAVAIPQLN